MTDGLTHLILSLDGLVTAEGTKLKFSEKIVKHAEEMKRKSMQIRIPKEALRWATRHSVCFSQLVQFGLVF